MKRKQQLLDSSAGKKCCCWSKLLCLWYELLWREHFFFVFPFKQAVPNVHRGLLSNVTEVRAGSSTARRAAPRLLQSPAEVRALPEVTRTGWTPARAKQNPPVVAPRPGYEGRSSGSDISCVSYNLRGRAEGGELCEPVPLAPSLGLVPAVGLSPSAPHEAMGAALVPFHSHAASPNSSHLSKILYFTLKGTKP